MLFKHWDRPGRTDGRLFWAELYHQSSALCGGWTYWVAGPALRPSLIMVLLHQTTAKPPKQYYIWVKKNWTTHHKGFKNVKLGYQISSRSSEQFMANPSMLLDVKDKIQFYFTKSSLCKYLGFQLHRSVI